MGMTFAVHAGAQSDLAQQRDASGLQHAGANPRQHVGAALAFEHDAVDAVATEDMGKQQSGRAAADDRYLCSRWVRAVSTVARPKPVCWIVKPVTTAGELRKA